MTNHDLVFKRLLTTFTVEFIELLLPEVYEYLDPDIEIVPLDKEIYNDLLLGESHEVDLLFRAKVRGQEAFFLIHIENQSTAQSGFAERMFRYFTRLYEIYRLPIYPIVIFSYDKPRRAEKNRFEIELAKKKVLQFEYTVIQLNRLSWRDYLNQPNPVAAALMSKMRMTAKERPKVKAQCLRLLLTLKLTPAKMGLISGFIESYLKLTALEERQFDQEIALFAPKDRETAMEIMMIGEREGLEKGLLIGRQKGSTRTISLQIAKRFGTPSPETEARIETLSNKQLDNLAVALLDFTSMEELDQWVAAQSASKN